MTDAKATPTSKNRKGAASPGTRGASGRSSSRPSRGIRDNNNEREEVDTASPGRRHVRARYPSKVKLNYPKVKTRQQPPSSEPEPHEPAFTSTVIRGVDTLFISICRKPEACVQDPKMLDTSKTPFEPTIKIVETDQDEVLNAEVEAVRKSCRKRPTPLNCFSPPKWRLLEDKSAPTESIEVRAPASAPPSVMSKQVDKRGSSLAAEKKRGSDNQTMQSAPPSPRGKKAMGDSARTSNAQPKSEGDFKETSKDGSLKSGQETNQKKESGSESQGASADYDFRRGIKASLTVEERRSLGMTSGIILKRADDDKARQLIKKYLPKGSDDPSSLTAPDDNKTWPPMKDPMDGPSLQTYKVISDQLLDARRLTDMPMRHRERRVSTLSGAGGSNIPKAPANGADVQNTGSFKVEKAKQEESRAQLQSKEFVLETEEDTEGNGEQREDDDGTEKVPEE